MDHLPTDHLPPDAPCLQPTEAAVGRGYIVETGEDAITLTLLVPEHGAITFGLDPDLAMTVATTMAGMCARLAKLITDPTTGGEPT